MVNLWCVLKIANNCYSIFEGSKNMNQEQIGKFIAEQRKIKGLTQEDLAERLGITKNAVSKWERGLCLMDMSLLKPLSEILEVSINEILAGEKIEEKDIEKKSEENIIKLTELVNLKSMKYGIMGMVLFSIILMIIAFLKDTNMSSIVSLLCAYNCVTFLSRYKIGKDKADLLTGILFFIAVICNTIAFILS